MSAVLVHQQQRRDGRVERQQPLLKLRRDILDVDAERVREREPRVEDDKWSTYDRCGSNSSSDTSCTGVRTLNDSMRRQKVQQNRHAHQRHHEHGPLPQAPRLITAAT